MDKQILERIENKVDKLDSRIDSIDITLAKQHEQLKIHIKRSDLLEQQIEPLKARDAMMVGGIKVLGLLAILAGIGEAIIKALEFIKDIK